MAKNNYARLKQEADIEAVVNYLGIAVRRKGNSCFVLCPLPNHADRHRFAEQPHVHELVFLLKTAMV